MKTIVSFNRVTLDYQVYVESNGFEIHNFRTPYEKLEEVKKQLVISLQNQLAEMNTTENQFEMD